MELATEMARLVLEMRDRSKNAKVKKKRLEPLTEHFLRITGQVAQSDSLSRVGTTEIEQRIRVN
jgi:hypothetical protein